MRTKIAAFAAFIFFYTTLFTLDAIPLLTDSQDIVSLFPKNITEVISFKEETIKEGEQRILCLRNAILGDLPFEKILNQLDEVLAFIFSRSSIMEAMSLTVEDESLRDEINKSYAKLTQYYDDFFITENEIYRFLKRPRKILELSEENQAFLQDVCSCFEDNGQNLTDESRLEVQELKKEISQLEIDFIQNLQLDSSTLFVSQKDLPGVSHSFLESYKKDEFGRFELPCNRQVYSQIMYNCKSEKTRRQYYDAHTNRAFPQNESLLKKLIAKRDALAKKLGYSSFNHLRLHRQIYEDPKEVMSFLDKLWQQGSQKGQVEFETLTQNLPKNIQMTSEGKLNEWDLSYVSACYEKRSSSINQEEISRYFPLETTFKGLMEVYQQFFGISITQEPISGLWNDDLQLLKISEPSGAILGYILLDLFPRPNKYPHACDIPLIPGGTIKNVKHPALDVVIANFPKPHGSQPTLLKHSDVSTFFHEFGHALHDIVINNNTLYFSNLFHIQYDFVELPSQLLEEWLWDPDILKMISSHYITKKPLSNALIQEMIRTKNNLIGSYIQAQCYLSFLALNYFSEGADKDPTAIKNDLKKLFLPHSVGSIEDHSHLSFSHLTDYGPMYYGYLWSKVFAKDLFQEIKKEGLLNPKVGLRYRQQVLEKGGAVRPQKLLYDFLKREPSQDAFIESLQMEKL